VNGLVNGILIMLILVILGVIFLIFDLILIHDLKSAGLKATQGMGNGEKEGS
jgi:preprotein translocase subunit SecG